MLLTHVSYGSEMVPGGGIEPPVSALRMRRIAINAYGAEIGADPVNCTPHLSLTRRAHRYLCLEGVTGASSRSCASHIHITNVAFRYLNLAGKLASTE